MNAAGAASQVARGIVAEALCHVPVEPFGPFCKAVFENRRVLHRGLHTRMAQILLRQPQIMRLALQPGDVAAWWRRIP
jgi:hypothetical protein